MIGITISDDNVGWTIVRNELKAIEHVIQIPNFLYAWTQRFQSPNISTDDELSEVKWSFFVAPHIYQGKFNDFINVGLNITDFGNRSQVFTHLVIELINSNNCSLHSKSLTVKGLKPSGEYKNSSLYLEQFFSISTTNYFPNGILTAKFTANYLINNRVITDGQYFIESVPECKKWNNLNLGYRLLTDSNNYHDISFVIGNKAIGAHKAIIYVKSPRLAQLFANNTSNQIIINNAEYDVFKEMISFIYTDKVNNLNKFAFKLLPLSVEYGLKRLKSLCETAIAHKVNEDNVIDLYKMAVKYKAIQLEEYILKRVKQKGIQMSYEKWIQTINEIKFENYSRIF